MRRFSIRLCIALIFFTVWSRGVRAQVSTPGTAEPSAAEEVQDPVADEDNQEDASTSPGRVSSGVSSIMNGVLLARNRVGGGFTASQSYTPDALVSGSTRQAASFSSLGTNFYANFSQFTLGYAFAYGKDQSRGVVVKDSRGTLGWNWGHRLTRNSTLNVSDSLESGTNATAASLALVIPSVSDSTQYLSTQDVFVARQRVTRNNLNTGIGYRFRKRTSLNLSASHYVVRYHQAQFGQSDGIQLGLNVDHQLNKWLYLNSGYSAYRNNGNSKLYTVDIHRLQIVGFRFQLGHSVEIATTGGVQYARQGRRLAGEAETSLTAGTSKTAFSIRYHQGLSSAVGVPVALTGHNVNLLLSHKFSRTMSLQTNAVYFRASSPSSSLENLAGGVGLNVALRPNLIAAIHYNQYFQRSQNLSVDALHFSRSSVQASINYLLPSLRVRRRSN
jgi:hypothetical protein